MDIILRALFALISTIIIILISLVTPLTRTRSGGNDYPHTAHNIDSIILQKSSQRDLPAAMTLDQISGSLKYAPRSQRRTTIHIGQRKLLMNEFEFLNKYMDSLNQNAYVVYAGAAPSNHMWLLSQLFPKIKFILVDPNEFLIYINGKKYTQYNDATVHESRPAESPVVYLKSSNINMYGVENRLIIKYTRSGVVLDRKNNGITGGDVISDIADLNSNSDVDEAAIKYITESSHRIYLIEGLYTVDISRMIRSQLTDAPVYFWSDIRTNMFNTADKRSGDGDSDEESVSPGDLDLVWNLAQQYNWIRELSPHASMLKYRVPFFRNRDSGNTLVDDDLKRLASADPDLYKIVVSDLESAREASRGELDMVGLYRQGKFKYMAGTIYMQPWAGASSTETRLVFNRDDLNNIVEYDWVDYEDRIFYYNAVERPFLHHKNSRADLSVGFDHCGDCAIESQVLDDYVTKFRGDIDDLNLGSIINGWQDHVREATGGRVLTMRGHGQLGEPLDAESLSALRSVATNSYVARLRQHLSASKK